MNFSEAIIPFSSKPLSYHLVRSLLQEYQRPNDKINELVKAGILSTLKRGLYIAGPKLTIAKPDHFLIANHLWGPSYVSIDAALSWYGFIPERVYEISSVTTKAAHKFSNTEGLFEYTRLPLPYYSFGIIQITLGSEQIAMIASPEKALCDKIITTAGLILSSRQSSRYYLLENLRADKTLLKTLNTDVIEAWISAAPKKSSLQMLVKTLHKL